LISKDVRFDRWLSALEARHLAELRFTEVSRALRALSSTYVERRGQLDRGAALTGAGKRAAFALFYAPIHYLIVREIVRALRPRTEPPSIVDLGCGTGAAGAAWAAACGSPPQLLGIDRHRWALSEAVHTYREFGLTARVRLANLVAARLPKPPVSMIAAFTMNELPEHARDSLLTQMLEHLRCSDRRQADHPSRFLVVEPVAGFVAPWWDRWSQAFVSAGGRSDVWRFRVELPSIVAKLDRAAGLNHRELTARSLWV
jgi:SAM-dependent methyltransferase